MRVRKARSKLRRKCNEFQTTLLSGSWITDRMTLSGRGRVLSVLGVCVLAAAFHIGIGDAPSDSATAYIVQGANAEEARRAVNKLGARAGHELSIINAVGAELTAEQLEALRSSDAGLRVYRDVNVKTSGSFYRYTKEIDGKEPYLHFPGLVGANALHEQGIDGSGVTVAVIDSGIEKGSKEFKKNRKDDDRLRGLYSAIKDKEKRAKDKFGHGSHIVSIIGNSKPSKDGRYNSLAPGVDLVVVKAFDENGAGVYSDVIRGMQWVLDNRDLYNIRVVNLSFSAAVRSNYWDDPLNQAVMKLWHEGVVVVASAGNTGPDAMSIGVPGNVPYIITVGAMTDNFTPRDPSDDYLASFSAAGPTYEGFVKPEIVAPGGHITGLMKKNTNLGKKYPEFHNFDEYFTMSGTSQATAVVSGIAALLLQIDPALSPDDVKCRLMATARQAAYPDGSHVPLRFFDVRDGHEPGLRQPRPGRQSGHCRHSPLRRPGRHG